MNGSQKELINYRRQKAKETLHDAEILLESHSLPSTVNRIYYALFYEIIALLLTEDMSSGKQSGVRALLNEHFVKTGKVPVEIGKFYASMFDFRQKSDYGDFVVFDEKKISDWLEEAKRHIQELERIIEQKIG